MTLGLQTIELSFDNFEEIGQDGKNSKVYRTHDQQLGSEKVVKMIERAKFSKFDDYYLEAQKIEASSHPNVVEIKCVGLGSDHICIIMPYYQRGSLKTLVQNRFLTVREVIKYSIDFLAGVQHIHDNGLIHFDIKIDNILVSDSDTALVADFGLTKHLDSAGFAIPDEFYSKQVPPDRFKFTNQTTAYDIYMSGGTLYRLCNGIEQIDSHFDTLKGSYSGYLNALNRGLYPDRKAYLPHIPRSLRLIINKALNPDPLKRYKSALELSNALGSINQLLDWRYDHSQKKWALDKGDKTIEIQVINTGTLWRIEASKTMKSSGKKQRIAAHCKINVADKDLSKSIQNSLLELEK